MAPRSRPIFAGICHAPVAAGLRFLVPGYAQWTWDQPERGLVLFGTFAGALAVAVFAWGSLIGLVMLGVAFAAHVTSAADVIRQGAFPGFGRWVPSVSAGFGLGLGCYAPALAAATLLAGSFAREGTSGESYLVNRWAFQSSGPATGDHLWYATPSGGHGLGRMVAGAGQAVEWTFGGVRIDGQKIDWEPILTDGSLVEMAFRVPDDHCLIAPARGTPGLATSSGMVLMRKQAIVGQAWAQVYPIWSRRLLL